MNSETPLRLGNTNGRASPLFTVPGGYTGSLDTVRGWGSQLLLVDRARARLADAQHGALLLPEIGVQGAWTILVRGG